MASPLRPTVGAVVAFRAKGQQIGGMITASQGLGNAMMELQRALAAAMLATAAGAGDNKAPPALAAFPFVATPSALPEIPDLIEQTMPEQSPTHGGQRRPPSSSQPQKQPDERVMQGQSAVRSYLRLLAKVAPGSRRIERAGTHHMPGQMVEVGHETAEPHGPGKASPPLPDDQSGQGRKGEMMPGMHDQAVGAHSLR